MMTKEWTKFVLVFVLGMLCESIITAINTVDARLIVTPGALEYVLQGGVLHNENEIRPLDLAENQGVIFAYTDPRNNEDVMFMPAPSQDNNEDFLIESEVEFNDFIQAI